MKTRIRLLWHQNCGFHKVAQYRRKSTAGVIYKKLNLTEGGSKVLSHVQDLYFEGRWTIDTSKQAWARSVTHDGRGFVEIQAREETQRTRLFPVLFLRDACACSKCVDANSTQKTFSTTEIPDEIKVKTLESTESGLTLTWENDIPGFENHITHIPWTLLHRHLSFKNSVVTRRNNTLPVLWRKSDAEKLEQIPYEDYISNDDTLFKSLKQLQDYGIVFLRGVPDDERAVEGIAERIGNLRDTFYGRTWNVRSVPQAKNVAYTKQYLGLHMDLLYMSQVPGLQLLHCLKNSASGGNALFSDSFAVFDSLKVQEKYSLPDLRLSFKYDNDGQYYSRVNTFLERITNRGPPSRDNIKAINYSPPFQGPLPIGPVLGNAEKAQHQSYRAFKSFAAQTEKEEFLLEYKYKPGDCVIFNNRRILHGRREFDPEAGERWLKGCYVDTDVFNSKLHVMSSKCEPEFWSQLNE